MSTPIRQRMDGIGRQDDLEKQSAWLGSNRQLVVMLAGQFPARASPRLSLTLLLMFISQA
jgi:hypothetical protein